MRFISPTYGVSETHDDILDKITNRIRGNPDGEWIVAIGTDSQNNGTTTKFCSAILILEKGNGGTYFYSVHSKPKIHVIQKRMLKEAELSIDLGRQLMTTIEERFLTVDTDLLDYNINFEIHCDLGHNGKSRDSINAAIGWITAEFGNKVTTRIKPDSPAASYVADKYTK